MNSKNEAIIFVVHKNDGTISTHKKSELANIIDETVTYVTAVCESDHGLMAVYTPTVAHTFVPTFSMSVTHDGEPVEDLQFIDAKTFQQFSLLLIKKRYVSGGVSGGCEDRNIYQLEYTTQLIFPIDSNTKVTLPLFTPEGKFIDHEIFNVLCTTQISNRNMKNPNNTDYGFYWSYNCSGLVINCKYERHHKTKCELVPFVNL